MNIKTMKKVAGGNAFIKRYRRLKISLARNSAQEEALFKDMERLKRKLKEAGIEINDFS